MDTYFVINELLRTTTQRMMSEKVKTSKQELGSNFKTQDARVESLFPRMLCSMHVEWYIASRNHRTKSYTHAPKHNPDNSSWRMGSQNEQRQESLVILLLVACSFPARFLSFIFQYGPELRRQTIVNLGSSLKEDQRHTSDRIAFPFKACSILP